jgi:hypothetical protein
MWSTNRKPIFFASFESAELRRQRPPIFTNNSVFVDQFDFWSSPKAARCSAGVSRFRLMDAHGGPCPNFQTFYQSILGHIPWLWVRQQSSEKLVVTVLTFVIEVVRIFLRTSSSQWRLRVQGAGLSDCGAGAVSDGLDG